MTPTAFLLVAALVSGGSLGLLSCWNAGLNKWLLGGCVLLLIKHIFQVLFIVSEAFWSSVVTEIPRLP